MRKFVVCGTVLFTTLASLIVTGQAFALEVQSIKVRSYLNEPLVATVPVQVANIQERNSLSATLAPEMEYVARGLQPLANPDDLIVQVVEGRALEQMLIEIRSLSQAQEPFVSIVLQLSWDGGTRVQEFTALLDPRPIEAVDEIEGAAELDVEEAAELAVMEPVEAQDDPVLQALAADLAGEPVTNASGEQPQVVIRKISPDAYLSGDSYGPGVASSLMAEPKFTGSSYGPVAAGETLWGIATQVRPNNSVSMAQVMEAIFQANPQAFVGSYNTLKKGSQLSIPDADSMRATAGRSDTSVAVSSFEDSVDEEVSTEVSESTSGTKPGIWIAPERPAVVDEQQLQTKDGLVTKPAVAPSVSKSEEISDADDASTATTEDKVTAEDDAIVDQASMETDLAAGQVDYAAVDAAGSETTAEVSAGEEDTAAEVSALEEQTSAEESSEVVEDFVAEEQVDTQDSVASEDGPSSNTTLLAGVILLVLLLTYGWYRRRRSAEGTTVPTSYATDVIEDDEPDAEPLEATYADTLPADLSEDDFTATPESDGDTTAEDKVSTVSAPSAADIEEQETETPEGAAAVLEQASTYLSYGLYESAAETLQQGIVANPDNADLRIKLLETHESAGNKDEFLTAVEDWQNSPADIDEDMQGRISAIAKHLAPSAALFAGAAVAAEGLEDSATENSVEDSLVLDTIGEQQVEPGIEAEGDIKEDELPLPDFDLDVPDAQAAAEPVADELDLPDPSVQAIDETEAASVALDFGADDALADQPVAADDITEDLELPELELDLDLGAMPEPDKSDTDTEEPSVNFDLDGLELDNVEDDLDFKSEEVASAATPDPVIAVDDEDVSLDEGDFELAVEKAPVADTEDSDEPAATPEDSEYDVKVDLAQAYLDMGEPDLAKGLLEEVMSGGNSVQREAAQKILDEIG